MLRVSIYLVQEGANIDRNKVKKQLQINTFDCLECVLHSEETSELRTRF